MQLLRQDLLKIRWLPRLKQRGLLTGQGRYPVHEDPESRQSVRRLEDTIESQGEREHQCTNVASSFSIRKSSDQHVGESAGENEELDKQQEDEALAAGWRDAALGVDGIEVRSEDHDAEKYLIGYFDDNVLFSSAVSQVSKIG